MPYKGLRSAATRFFQLTHLSNVNKKSFRKCLRLMRSWATPKKDPSTTLSVRPRTGVTRVLATGQHRKVVAEMWDGSIRLALFLYIPLIPYLLPDNTIVLFCIIFSFNITFLVKLPNTLHNCISMGVFPFVINVQNFKLQANINPEELFRNIFGEFSRNFRNSGRGGFQDIFEDFSPFGFGNSAQETIVNLTFQQAARGITKEIEIIQASGSTR